MSHFSSTGFIPSLLPDQTQVFAALSAGAAYGRPDVDVNIIETLISRVHLLPPSHVGVSGDVYKVKKNINWGWLNYSTLEHRKNSCFKEISRNERNAPGVYKGVAGIKLNGDGHIVVDDQNEVDGIVLDYAVHMRRIPNEANLSAQIAAGLDVRTVMPDISEAIARMHSGAEVLCSEASDRDAFMTELCSKIQNNSSLVDREATKLNILEKPQLQNQVERAFLELNATLMDRADAGCVRVCHGDLHTGNIWLEGAQTMLLDGIEFNDDFTTLDVLQDLAFLGLEFAMKQQPQLSDELFKHYARVNPEVSDAAVYKLYLAERLLYKAMLILTLDVPPATGSEYEKQLNRGRTAVMAVKEVLESLS